MGKQAKSLGIDEEHMNKARTNKGRRFEGAAGFILRRIPQVDPASEHGASLVELAVSSSIIFSMILGMFQISLALYAYHFTADAAREASRWAIVRGNKCSTYTSGLDHCGASQTDIQSYVQGLGYPYANSMTVTVTWLTATAPPAATWTACGTTNSCKSPGNQVKVTVSYNVPIYIPFWRGTGIRVGSDSAMVIAQ
jgi:Flp pilus assembly protein TadG